MSKLDTCLSPELLHLYDVSDKTVVVVDILRATSCMVAGISTGVDKIIAFDDLDQCLSMKSKGYFTAGERGGEKVEGFDIGNSPFSYMQPELKGQAIAVTTTNGTRAIELSRNAAETLIAAFLNLTSTANYIIDTHKPVIILCAAWKGRVNLEDTLFAGALANLLLNNGYDTECDATLVATKLYENVQNDLEGALRNSSHVRRLQKFGIQKDIEYCIKQDVFTTVVGVLNKEIRQLA